MRPVQETVSVLSRELVDSFLKTIMDSWAGADSAPLFAFLDEDLEYFDDGMPAPVRGKAAALEFFDQVSHALSEFEAVLLEGPMLHPTKPIMMIHWRYGGHHTGDWGDLKATGNRFRLDGASLYEFRDNKVVRWRCIWNVAEMVRQLSAAQQS
jgi:predicted ester cyclase